MKTIPGTISRIASLARQATFPRPFRILLPGAASPLEVFVAALTADPPPPAADPGESSLDQATAYALCDALFRLRANLEALASEGGETRESRSMQRALRKMEKTLADNRVECRDLTGEIYDEGRIDFELLGPAERRPGIAAPTIVLCERPAILIGGKLTQKAKGIVAVPAEPKP